MRVLATHSIRQFPLHFPSRASQCATRFRRSSTTQLEGGILEQDVEDPGVSRRRLVATFPVSRRSVWRVLQEWLLYPLHLQHVHGLTPADHPTWDNFCRWFVQQTPNPQLLSPVLFTDGQPLVGMVSQTSTINISGRRRIHAVQSMLNTRYSSRLKCRLVLWVIGTYTSFAKFYGQCLV